MKDHPFETVQSLATRYGVTRQTIAQWRLMRKIPEPIYVIDGRPLWEKSQFINLNPRGAA